MKLNQSNNLPVAEIIECNVTGQQTIIEIEGRLKFLRIGDKLYTQPSQVVQPVQPAADALDAARYRLLRDHEDGNCVVNGDLLSGEKLDCAVDGQTGELS